MSYKYRYTDSLRDQDRTLHYNRRLRAQDEYYIKYCLDCDAKTEHDICTDKCCKHVG